MHDDLHFPQNVSNDFQTSTGHLALTAKKNHKMPRRRINREYGNIITFKNGLFRTQNIHSVMVKLLFSVL